VQVTWLDEDGRRHVHDVEPPLADAVGRVLVGDLGLADVRVAGVPVREPAKDYHRRLFRVWERGGFDHADGQEGGQPR